MIACPSQDLLVGLLENRLDGVELDGIVVHIEICISCQQQLEDLTRGEVWKSTLGEGLRRARAQWRRGCPVVPARGQPDC